MYSIRTRSTNMDMSVGDKGILLVQSNSKVIGCLSVPKDLTTNSSTDRFFTIFRKGSLPTQRNIFTFNFQNSK